MRYLIVLALSILAFSCNSGKEGQFRIEGDLEGAFAGDTRVFLRKQAQGAQTVEVDTAQIVEGSFVFDGNIEIPELHFIFVEGVQGSIPLVLEEGTIWVRGHKDSLRQVAFGGTPQNDAYSAYLEGAKQLSVQRNSMNRDMQQAMMQKDTALMLSLRDEYFELQDRNNRFEQTFVEENPDALISALLLARMLQNKTAPVAEVDSLYQTLSDKIKTTGPAMDLSEELVTARRTAIGSKAPEFSAPTPEGQDLALSQALGTYTLVDFWAAWCRPCRAENPNIVNVYQKYKDRGFTVFGVSLDRNADDWKEAIQADGLEWKHVSNVRYFDEIADLYNVRAIPANFLLDKNGVIIAKNLRGPALEAKIAELLP